MFRKFKGIRGGSAGSNDLELTVDDEDDHVSENIAGGGLNSQRSNPELRNTANQI